MQKGANSTLQKFVVLSELNLVFFKKGMKLCFEVKSLIWRIFIQCFIIIFSTYRTSYIETYMKAFEIYVHTIGQFFSP